MGLFLGVGVDICIYKILLYEYTHTQSSDLLRLITFGFTVPPAVQI